MPVFSAWFDETDNADAVTDRDMFGQWQDCLGPFPRHTYVPDPGGPLTYPRLPAQRHIAAAMCASSRRLLSVRSSVPIGRFPGAREAVA
jgi:hypothetical protein